MILIWKYKFYVLLAGVLLWLGLAKFTSDRAHSAEIAAREQVFNVTAQQLGAAMGRERSEAEVVSRLSSKNAALVAELKKAAKGSRVGCWSVTASSPAAWP